MAEASITLTQNELYDITHLKRPSAQARWLREQYGIEANRRPDGSLSVPKQLYFQKAGIAKPAPRKPKLRLSDAP